MNGITPNLEQFQQLVARAEQEGAVVMLNLLEFKRPDYLEAHADREAALERTVVLACTPGLPGLAAPS